MNKVFHGLTLITQRDGHGHESQSHKQIYLPLSELKRKKKEKKSEENLIEMGAWCRDCEAVTLFRAERGRGANGFLSVKPSISAPV